MRVGDSELCLDLSELSGVALMPRLLSLPGSRRDLLGVVAVRGRILPVFDLAALLGLTGAAGLAPSMRWMALVDDQLGFAFERLQAHIDAPLLSLRDAAARYVRRVVSIETDQRGIIDLRSLKDSLSRLDPPSPPSPATSSVAPASPQGSLS